MQSEIPKKYQDMNKAIKWSNFIVNKPLKALALFLFFLLILLPGIFSIQSKWSPRIWFDADHPEIQKLNRFEKQFGSDTFISLGVYHPKGIFQNSTLSTVKDLTEQMWLVKDVIRVESMSNYNYIEADGDDITTDSFVKEIGTYTEAELTLLQRKAMSDDVLPDFFISPDGTYTIVYAYLKPTLAGEETDFTEVVKQTRERIGSVLNKDKDLKIFVTGPAAGNDAFREVSEGDNLKLIPFMFAFLLGLLFLQFRSISCITLTLGLIGLTIGVTFGLMGHTGIIFNSLLGAIPGVLLAICTADAVHIFTSFFHFRGLGNDSKMSIRLSLIKNFQPTLLTSLSTAISFFTITHTDLAPIRDLGYLCGFGTLMAWLFTYLIIGPCLSLLSSFLDKHEVKVFEFSKLLSSKSKEESAQDHAHQRKVPLFFTEVIYKIRYPIILIFISISGLSLYIALQNEVNSDPMKYFHKRVPIRQAYDFTASKLDGLRGIEFVVDSGKEDGIKDPEFLNKLDAYMNEMVSDPDVTRVRSIREIIKKMNETLYSGDKAYYKIPDSSEAVGQLLFLYTMGLPPGLDLNNQFSIDGRRLRIKVTWRIETSKESEIKSDQLVALADKYGLNVETGGNAPIYLSMNQKVVNTFFSSMAMALVLVSFLLFLVYRDLFISTLAMLPNVIPLIFGGALMQLLGKPIDIGTSIVSTVCLGIAVDDTIHFISSYKQYRGQGMDPKQAICETFLVTGKALVVTTILLVVGFGAFIFADFVPNRNFGMLCAMILALALLTDLLFLPALLLTVDKGGKKSNQEQDVDSTSSAAHT